MSTQKPRKGAFRGIKIRKIPCGPRTSLHLQRSFRETVGIYHRSMPATAKQATEEDTHKLTPAAW